MEKLVFKNMYLNIVVGGLLILLSVLGYFLKWFEDYLPIVIAVVLVLLSAKRFWYSFKKITSKNATLILIIELFLDFLFAGLLIYLQDHVALFIGLIIYIRGVSYLLINYIATRKINLTQYIFNIGYVTLGAFLIFTNLDIDMALVFGLAFLLLIVGAVYLQAGITELVKKEELEEAEEKAEKQQLKEKEQELKELKKENKIIEKQQDKIEALEEKVKEVQQIQKVVKEENKELKKTVEEAVKPKKPTPVVNLEAKTVAELRLLAKEKQLSGYSQLTKAELIEKLKEK